MKEREATKAAKLLAANPALAAHAWSKRAETTRTIAGLMSGRARDVLLSQVQEWEALARKAAAEAAKGDRSRGEARERRAD